MAIISFKIASKVGKKSASNTFKMTCIAQPNCIEIDFSRNPIKLKLPTSFYCIDFFYDIFYFAVVLWHTRIASCHLLWNHMVNMPVQRHQQQRKRAWIGLSGGGGDDFPWIESRMENICNFARCNESKNYAKLENFQAIFIRHVFESKCYW